MTRTSPISIRALIKLYRNRAEWARLTRKVQNPQFVVPPQAPSLQPGFGLQETGGGLVQPEVGARAKLEGFATSGIKTPHDLAGLATTSADEKSREDAISVNIFPPIGGGEGADRARLRRTPDFATTSAAGGAIPVVLEQKGDTMPSRLSEEDRSVLTKRAASSALAVIDPTNLAKDHGERVMSKLGPDNTGTGELILSGGIASSDFVRLLVPASFGPSLSDEFVSRHRITFVGKLEQQTVSFNASRGAQDVTIDVPDYQSALEEIFRANPNSVFLTHVLRIGTKDRIGATGAGPQSPVRLRCRRVACVRPRARAQFEWSLIERTDTGAANVPAPSGVGAVVTALDNAFAGHKSYGDITDLRICFRKQNANTDVYAKMLAAGATVENIDAVLTALAELPGWDGQDMM